MHKQALFFIISRYFLKTINENLNLSDSHLTLAISGRNLYDIVEQNNIFLGKMN